MDPSPDFGWRTMRANPAATASKRPVATLDRRERPGAGVEALFANVPDLLVVIAPDGTVEDANPAWGEMLGRPPATVVGRAFLDFVHPEDVALTRERAEARASQREFVTRLTHRDGGARSILWSATRSGERWDASGKDVTE